MIIGYHLIMTAYGFWLPNDPRGSWSDFVRSWELLRFGPATKVETTRSVAGVRHDVAVRRAAKKALKYPEVYFTGVQARSIGNGFAVFAKKSGLTVWACSILPDHVHLVVGRHRYEIEQIANLLKGAATRQLVKDNCTRSWRSQKRAKCRASSRAGVGRCSSTATRISSGQLSMSTGTRKRKDCRRKSANGALFNRLCRVVKSNSFSGKPKALLCSPAPSACR
jgi:REP element-mobilizing transposase RayT